MEFFDLILIILGIATGAASLTAPKWTWNLLQSKKLKAERAFTEKERKQMIIGGFVILGLSFAFLITVLFT